MGTLWIESRLGPCHHGGHRWHDPAVALCQRLRPLLHRELLLGFHRQYLRDGSCDSFEQEAGCFWALARARCGIRAHFTRLAWAVLGEA